MNPEHKDTTTFKVGYEVGQFIYQHPILTLLIGAVIAVGFVYLLNKLIKQFRTFGE